jgi:hypothetical protein
MHRCREHSLGSWESVCFGSSYWARWMGTFHPEGGLEALAAASPPTPRLQGLVCIFPCLPVLWGGVLVAGKDLDVAIVV